MHGMTNDKNNQPGARRKSAGGSRSAPESNGNPAVSDPDPAAPLSPEWLRAMVQDTTSDFLRDALKDFVGWLKRPGDKFMIALTYAVERDADIAKITLATGSEHWAVKKDGTIIAVFPDLDGQIAEHPDLQHLSDDLFVPARGLVAHQLPERTWWPFGRRARLPRLPPSADINTTDDEHD